MEKRGWFCRLNNYEYGPFVTERDAVAFGKKIALPNPFATYYGAFFNYLKHKV